MNESTVAAAARSADALFVRRLAYKAGVKARAALAAGQQGKAVQLLGVAQLLNDLATLKERQLRLDLRDAGEVVD